MLSSLKQSITQNGTNLGIKNPWAQIGLRLDQFGLDLNDYLIPWSGHDSLRSLVFCVWRVGVWRLFAILSLKNPKGERPKSAPKLWL
ncbi:MAG: hypothetical protein A2527_03115 [Candidatus Lambdaproteobacteria bacterium RIFOXYD2_FULL_50_16]|uniref:Uncharacterized protein n=1 Tax=Candidatus Lambdaproteobacteria bacterium RIFOXYD2_FULL_50_16 TaxID=1817772 RepID=A0A1F6GG30_9PROT|nr:MAG: hypothetical protein A2527_03115 [Candidatus Lambdaproteobacteria bacterium RIFOXYD2_FULL_50_16]